MADYFLDTYALLGYFEGNKGYIDILNDDSKTKVLTILNLMEVYYALLKQFDMEIAKKYFEAFTGLQVPISEELIKRAMHTRLNLNNEKKNVSYVDAIGYQYALDNGLIFLTGDEAFKGLPSVKFIK